MKKNLIFFVLGFVSLIASFVIFSCEKPANVTPISGEDEERSYIELFHSIDTYDASFQEKLPYETRASWGNFWKIIKGGLKVIGADIAGGLSGASLGGELDKGSGGHTCEISFGIVGAVAASAAKAIEEFQTNDTIPKLPVDQPKSFSSNETGSIIGEAHNEIMEKLFNMYGEGEVTTISEERLHQDVLRLTREYLGTDLEKCDNAMLQVISQRTAEIKRSLANLSDEETVAYLRNCGYAKKEDLKLIADYLVKIQSIQDLDLRKQYISGYMKLIKKATISENSKRVVLEGTSTAVNSLMLWERAH